MTCSCPPQEHDVETPYGTLRVVIRGAPKGNKPAILTYHDVGLNREYPHRCGTGGGAFRGALIRRHRKIMKAVVLKLAD